MKSKIKERFQIICLVGPHQLVKKIPEIFSEKREKSIFCLTHHKNYFLLFLDTWVSYYSTSCPTLLSRPYFGQIIIFSKDGLFGSTLACRSSNSSSNPHEGEELILTVKGIYNYNSIEYH